MLHASEAAFWSDLPLQMASLMQTVPSLPDTEIIIESTANGYNDFHNLWRKAEAGDSEFVPIFLPGSQTGVSGRIAGRLRYGWRRAQACRIVRSRREPTCLATKEDQPTRQRPVFPAGIPSNAQEAFVSSNFDSFIPAALVIKARREKVEEKFGPLIVGVDPAHLGPDRTSIAWRRGRVIEKVESRRGIKRPAINRGQSRICASAAFLSPGAEADAVALCFSEPEGSGFVRDKNFYQDLLKRYEGAYV